MQSKHTIINGDSRCMTDLKDESVQLVVTSPPYWQLKDYGTQNQIGYNDSYEDYINHLNLVWQECHRVLENGCRLCINIGDQFARAVYYGRYKVIPIRTEIIKFCESVGFDYMGAIIWQKQTTTNTTGGASLMGSYPTPRNGIISIDYEFILLFKKLGDPKKIDKEVKNSSKMTKEEWKRYFSGHWNFGGTRQDGHIAMFPEELPKRLIKMFSFKGETVLDPFMGSGTTSLAAKNLHRNSVGYEINSDFLPIIKDKLKTNQLNLENIKYSFKKQAPIEIDFSKAIQKLTYIFKDFHTFDKKTDPKKLQFGSKIDNNKSKKEEYFSVKEVLSPGLIRLNNDLLVRLIGIKEDRTMNGQAVDYLREKTKNQRVFMRFDATKYDKDNYLFCYLYLKNKTFLNAHLIKQGLALADISYTYKYVDRFAQLLNQEKQNG